MAINTTRDGVHLQGSGSMRRSKSVGEGRSTAPADDFVLITRGPSSATDDTEEFKCGKLCLFLPRVVKGKTNNSSNSHKTPDVLPLDCGSFSSSADNTNPFFDLPLEMIRCSISDMQSPVKAVFVFDKDAELVKLQPQPNYCKGVLKNSLSSGSMKLKSQDSIKQVRFSTSTCQLSSSTCVTPRLRKAREDFNAFLEAQTT